MRQIFESKSKCRLIFSLELQQDLFEKSAFGTLTNSAPEVARTSEDRRVEISEKVVCHLVEEARELHDSSLFDENLEGQERRGVSIVCVG